jgi:hypothetical protein
VWLYETSSGFSSYYSMLLPRDSSHLFSLSSNNVVLEIY